MSSHATSSNTGTAVSTKPTAPAGAKISTRKPKSPPAPSFSLRDCFTDIQKVYNAYGRAGASRPEIATTLGVAADSGPTARRLFSYKEFGLLEQAGDSFRVSEAFIRLKSAEPGSPEFKTEAYGAVLHCDLFRELISSFNSKLPPQSAVATRLESQKRFNHDRAKELGDVLEDSLRFAGVLDGNGNIVPARARGDEHGEDLFEEVFGQEREDVRRQRAQEKRVSAPGNLTIEIALKDTRRVVVSYPPNLASEEAEKVANVLRALLV